MRHIGLILVSVALGVGPAGLSAQAPDPAVRAALSSLRESGRAERAVAILTQERRSRSASELNAFADSLVSIATSYRHGESRDHQRAASAASSALLAAAHPVVLAERATKRADRENVRAPVPYPRAFEALVRIYEDSRDLRGGTLYLIAQFPDSVRAIAFLSRVASSNDSSAPTAIRHLSTDLGDAGLTELRRLYAADIVIEPTAKEHLKALAHVHGWTR